uniref:Ground-like domain-containing protein n=1 Tax=Elaeophora elaphi TaxID=1147741 RepID=A0A0R3RXF3_9BILA
MSRRSLVLVVLLEFSVLGHAMLFGSGGGCCCECGIPMPSVCGCPPPPPLPICPPPLPCPPPVCPVCQICSPPPSCPPPPVALCPPPQPVYLPTSNCGCGTADNVVGSYASAKGQKFGPAHDSPYGVARRGAQTAGLTVTRGASPPSVHPHHLLKTGTDSNIQELPSIQSGAEKSDDPTDVDVTHQLSPLLSTATPATERRAHGAVTVSENKCNSAVLRNLIIKNMDHTDPVISKRSIHRAALESVKEDDVDIICSDAGFTYIVSTTEYCEAQKEKVICFVYKKP